MFKNYLKVAVRNIIKHKGYSFISISGLTLGMACCIFIFLWVQDELNFDRFHKNADNIYRVIVEYPGGISSNSPLAMAPYMKRNYPEVTKMTRLRIRQYPLKYADTNSYEIGLMVDADFFRIFSFPFIKGNPQKAFPDDKSIVISQKIAYKFFGNKDPLGKILRYMNNYDLTVTGIIENVDSNSHLRFDFVVPIQIIGEKTLRTWAWDNTTYLLLRENADLDGLRKKIAGIIMKEDKRSTIKTRVDLQPLTRIHLYSLSGGGPIVYVYLFSAIALIVLLIACINFTNLSTAMSSYRSKEIGMRKVFGSTRVNIISQFLGESMLMSFIAILLAIVLVLLLLPEFNSLSLKQLRMDFSGSILQFLVLILIAIITGVISGGYAALFLSSFQPVNILKNLQGKRTRQVILRKILVIIQFACVVALIICTQIAARQLNYINNRDLGFNRENVISIYLNNQIREKYEVFKNRILQNENILKAAGANRMPLNITIHNPVYWEGRGPDQYENFCYASVDFDYFDTFNMKTVKGKSFSREFPTDKENYIVNETAVKFMGFKDPIGKMFSMWRREGKIIGVIKDFHSTPLHNKIIPVVFNMAPSTRYYRILFVKVKPGTIKNTLNYLKNVIKELAPDFPFRYQFLDDVFDKQYISEKQTGTIFKYFTFLAIFISCMGLYSLVSYLAEQKTKEIGIRKVFGASVQQIIYLLTKEFVKLVMISTLIAFPIAYYVMSKWLQNYAYHTNINIRIFIISGVISVIIAFFTVFYRSFRAASANPTDSLKYE